MCCRKKEGEETIYWLGGAVGAGEWKGIKRSLLADLLALALTHRWPTSDGNKEE